MKIKRLFLIIILSIAFGRAYGQSDPILDIGSKSAPFSYTNTITSSGEANTFRYQFTISTMMDITISHCESTVENTGIFLLDENEDYIEINVGSPNCSNPNLAHLEVADLQPGTYYVWIDWSTSSIGNIVTVIEGARPRSSNPEGNTMNNAINMGVYSSSFSYTDTKDTNDFTNDYQGRPYSNDVFYQFTLSKDMNVVISHCGSSVSDSYVWLLDSSGNRIGYNNDYSGIEACSNNKLSYLDMPNLAAGTYYVVSEGNSENGEIITQIKGTTYNLGVGSTDQNYILTRTYMNDAGTAWQDKIDYFDGLGRPQESVLAKSSPTGSDLVTYQEYDGAGRESSSWLPVVSPNNNGAFVSLSTIKGNINASYPNEAKPYTLPVYEASPLNRVLEQYGPGQAWQNNSRSAKMAYLANIAGNDTLNCVYYKVEANSTDTLVTITYGGNYETAQLYVTRSTDEDGNASFEFKDKLGQVVLVRQIQRNGSSKTTYDTYYIYDDYGNLTAVLPPMASDNMKNGTSWTNANSAVLRNYAYLYRYDSRNRCVQKRLPGASWNYYVYDRGDRLIFSQDGEQRRQGKWMFTIPDVFGRTLLTGICTSTGSKTISIGTFDSNVLKGVFSTTGSYNGYNLQLDGVTLTLTGATVGTASYYDNYNFLQLNGFSTLAYDSSIQTDYGSRYTGGYQGILTGSYTAQAPGSTASVSLCSALYYDNRNRIIQSASTNHLGGKETECISYNFTGQPMRKKHIHSATGKATQMEFYSYDYDHAGRLVTVKHKLGSNGNEFILAKNTYDELGRLKTNKKNDQANLTTTYTYNVRSWMKSSSSPLFSQTLYYNDSYGSNTPRYNGNISAMSWTTSGDKTRGYNFAYDNLSRLTAAGYLEGRVANTSYGTSYAYDKHGNMTNLIRNGRTGTSTFGAIDNLSMIYAGNQLIKADDAGTNVTLSASMDFKNNSTAAKEYFYDLNGNLNKDLNKGITGITYNFLNLPQSVVISNTLGQATNTYTYAADGRKLRTVQQWGSTNSKQTDYVDNVIYESVNGTAATLKRILVDGGYIEGGAYYFYLTDHLGNNRVVANASGGIVQTNHYYPFGMSFAEGVTASGQPYKYNGKELDTERGLNLYDYSARLMDPALGRFSTVDPLAEKYYSVSPYIYVGNNPMNAIDLRGDTITTVITSTVDGVTTNTTYYYGQDAKGNYGFLDSSGQMYSGGDQFVVSLTTALGNLQNGVTGKALSDDLINSTNTVQIGKARGSQTNSADPSGKYIIWNQNSVTGGVNTAGNETRPAYIGLGHEMAHIQDTWNGTIDNSTWVTFPGASIRNAEKYATHVENQLRAENGIPLRTHYGIDVSTGTRVGLENTRIIIPGTTMSNRYTQSFAFYGITLTFPFIYK